MHRVITVTHVSATDTPAAHMKEANFNLLRFQHRSVVARFLGVRYSGLSFTAHSGIYEQDVRGGLIGSRHGFILRQRIVCATSAQACASSGPPSSQTPSRREALNHAVADLGA